MHLEKLCLFPENHQWWEKALGKGVFSKSKTLNVEITAYALLTLLSSKKDSECLPILKWLLNQRNDQGGFEGTQDTIVGLEALAKFASKITSKDTKVKIELNSESTVAVGKKKVYFDVNADNALILQSQKVSPISRKSYCILARVLTFFALFNRFHLKLNQSKLMPVEKDSLCLKWPTDTIQKKLTLNRHSH